MSAILAVLAPLFSLFNSLMDYFRDKKLTDGAIAAETVKVQQKVLADEKVATDIRDAVREHATTNPASLREPDPDSRD